MKTEFRNKHSNANNNRVCIIILLLIGVITFLSACSHSSQFKEPSNESSEYTSEYNYSSDSFNSKSALTDTILKHSITGNAQFSNDTYDPDPEDAYEEGIAQAEEDRIAGHPGVNCANDYDDDEVNDAYEEGYEDE